MKLSNFNMSLPNCFKCQSVTSALNKYRDYQLPLAFWSLSRIIIIPNFLWNPFVALADHHLERLLDRHSAMLHSLKQLKENVFLAILQATSNLDLPCVKHIHSEAQHAEPFHQKMFVIFALQYQFFQCHVLPRPGLLSLGCESAQP